jgi:hypothetical protein
MFSVSSNVCYVTVLGKGLLKMNQLTNLYPTTEPAFWPKSTKATAEAASKVEAGRGVASCCPGPAPDGLLGCVTERLKGEAFVQGYLNSLAGAGGVTGMGHQNWAAECYGLSLALGCRLPLVHNPQEDARLLRPPPSPKKGGQLLSGS